MWLVGVLVIIGDNVEVLSLWLCLRHTVVVVASRAFIQISPSPNEKTDPFACVIVTCLRSACEYMSGTKTHRGRELLFPFYMHRSQSSPFLANLSGRLAVLRAFFSCLTDCPQYRQYTYIQTNIHTIYLWDDSRSFPFSLPGLPK